MTEALDPQILVADIMAGKAEAETALVQQFSRAVRFTLRRAVPQPEAADDLFQETFSTAIQKIRAGELKTPSSLGSYLLSIARFSAIGWGRRKQKHETASLTHDLPSPCENPLTSLLRREQAAKVRDSLQDLATERDRQILHRFYIAEEDPATICADLDISHRHLSRVLHRARNRYKELLLKKGGL